MKNFKNKIKTANIAAMILIIIGIAAAQTNAATYTVNDANDAGDGICNAASCTFRDAVDTANSTPDDDVIEFASPLFDSPQTITLSGVVYVNNNGSLTINGPGADKLTITSANRHILFVQGGIVAEIKGVTLSGASVGGGEDGAGLYNSGSTLTLSDSVVSGNMSERGGGIVNNTGSLTINNSTISNNKANRVGGGILNLNGGIIILNGSTVSNNSGGGSGGGIYSSGTLELNNSTISNNSGGGSGGGIYSNRTSELNNSTVSNNSGVNGGGVFHGGGTLTVNSSTISDNSAGQGGGLYVSFFVTVTLNNSIIANSSSGGDCYNYFGTVNASNSLIQDGLSCVNGTNLNNLTGDPLLGPLQDNGGPTFTHALLDGSPAIDTGSNALIPVDENNQPVTTDQRGTGFPRIANSIVDMGAFETTPPNTAPTINVNAVSVAADSASNQSVAAVGDAEDALGDLLVSIDGASTSNGVTISNPAVDSSGNVSANVAAVCSAANASFNLKVTDSGNLMADAVLNVSVTSETEAPVIAAISDVVAYLPAKTSDTSMIVSFPTPSATDNCDSSVTVTTTPASGTSFSIGDTEVTVDAVDDAGNLSSKTFTVSVRYAFTGFFFPVRNNRTNLWKAGIPVAVRFSLSGRKGRDIYETSPVSQQIDCTSGAPIGAAEPVRGLFINRPLYFRLFDRYSSLWKTDRSWKGMCRQLQVTLNDGSTHTADFKFK